MVAYQHLTDPLYREVVERLELIREQGSLREQIDADTWAPAVYRHCPSGAHLGEPCGQCQEPWPCQFLRGLMLTGLVPGPRGRPRAELN